MSVTRKAIFASIERVLSIPDADGFSYVIVLSQSSHDDCWPRLAALAAETRGVINFDRNLVVFPNGSEVRMVNVDKTDVLRGQHFDQASIYIDEMGQLA
jgi:hypothetical protein